MLEININDVVNYCWCPKYYAFAKKANAPNIHKKYDESLHRTFYTYLHALQQGTLRESMRLLKYKWGREWIKQKKNSELIYTPSACTRDTYENKRRMGIDAIITFDQMMDEPQFPIVINRPYQINISDNLVLTGTWEYVREVKDQNGNNQIQLMKFQTESNNFHTKHISSHDLELTAAAFAFIKSFEIDPKHFELGYLDVYRRRIIYSHRSKKDYEMLFKTVRDAAICIHNGICCACPDKRCYHCEYRDLCEISFQQGDSKVYDYSEHSLR